MAQVVLNYKHALSVIKAAYLSCLIMMKTIQNVVFDIVEKLPWNCTLSLLAFIVPTSSGYTDNKLNIPCLNLQQHGPYKH